MVAMAIPPMQPARVLTALGTLALLLPEDAALAPDPGVADGELLAWAPAPELGAFSVSHGPAEGRRAEDLLALERGFADEVDVEADEGGELRLLVRTRGARDLHDDGAGGRIAVDRPARCERVRFRFWTSGGEAVRAGYRLDETAPKELRAVFEQIADSLRLEAT
jgi:hypothetical protein